MRILLSRAEKKIADDIKSKTLIGVSPNTQVIRLSSGLDPDRRSLILMNSNLLARTNQYFQQSAEYVPLVLTWKPDSFQRNTPTIGPHVRAILVLARLLPHHFSAFRLLALIRQCCLTGHEFLDRLTAAYLEDLIPIHHHFRRSGSGIVIGTHTKAIGPC